MSTRRRVESIARSSPIPGDKPVHNLRPVIKTSLQINRLGSDDVFLTIRAINSHGYTRCPFDGARAVERRTFLSGSTATLLLTMIRPGRPAQAAANDELAQLEMQLGGRLGVAAIDTGSGAHLAHRGTERFALCSTFKWLLAAAILARVDRHAASLDERVSFGPHDLLPNSPVTRTAVSKGALPIRTLCEAVIEVSDNTAANALLKTLGGPPALTRYLRGLGDATTRLDRVETSLNSNQPGDPRDTTTPLAMLGTMQTVLLGDALSRDARATLMGWLKNCRTGLHRLRAGLPSDWVVGDKTGTGENGAVNDVAIAWPPGRQPLLIAAYWSESQAAPDDLDAAHARIGAIVAAAFARRSGP